MRRPRRLGSGRRRTRPRRPFLLPLLLGALFPVLAACHDAPVREGAGLRFEALAEREGAVPPLDRFAARDGRRLPVRHYESESSLHLVLLHGAGYHGAYLHPLARRLVERRAAEVHVPDLRGHGRSPERRGDIGHVAQLEEDVADLVAHVRTREPGARVVVGGHSSGGGLALRYAAGDARQGPVAGWLLLAPYLGHDAPTTRPGSGGFARAHVGRILTLRLLNAVGVDRWNDAVVLEFDVPEPWRDGSETRAYSYRLATGFAPRAAARELAALEAPLLVLVGDADEAFRPTAYAPLIAEHAPHGQVELMAEASHLGLVGDARTAERAARWLETLGAPPSAAAR